MDMHHSQEAHAEIREEVRKLCARFPGEYWRELDTRRGYPTEFVKALTDAHFQLMPGEHAAIVGDNGAGKSTLFNLISGRFGPSSGEILLNGQRIENKAPYEINRMGLSRSFQITNIFPKLSVFENLRCAVLWSLGYKYTFLKFLSGLKDANELTEKYMAMIRLDKKRDLLAMNLTYAEQRALEIGITIAGGSNVILLDEPTAGMSRSETSRFINLIKEVTMGKTLLTVEKLNDSLAGADDLRRHWWATGTATRGTKATSATATMTAAAISTAA